MLDICEMHLRTPGILSVVMWLILMDFGEEKDGKDAISSSSCCRKTVKMDGVTGGGIQSLKSITLVMGWKLDEAINDSRR